MQIHSVCGVSFLNFDLWSGSMVESGYCITYSFTRVCDFVDKHIPLQPIGQTSWQNVSILMVCSICIYCMNSARYHLS